MHRLCFVLEYNDGSHIGGNGGVNE